MYEALYYVLKSLMTAQSYIDQQTKKLASSYKKDNLLQKFTVPRAALDRIELDLKFAVVIEPSKENEKISDEDLGNLVKRLYSELEDYFMKDEKFELIDAKILENFCQLLSEELFIEKKKYFIHKETIVNENRDNEPKQEKDNSIIKSLAKNAIDLVKEALEKTTKSLPKNSPLTIISSKNAIGKTIRGDIYEIVNTIVEECTKIIGSNKITLIFETDKIAKFDSNQINSAKCYIEMAGKNIVISDKEGKKKMELI
jgi:hypothetical protein